MSEKRLISISTTTFLKILALLALLWIGYLILDILILLFVSLILASLIDPLADWFEKKKLGRGVAVLLVYVVLLGVFALIGIILVPAVITQFSQLTANLGNYWEKILVSLSAFKNWGMQYGLWDKLKEALPTALQSGTYTVQKLVSSVFGFFDGIVSLVLVLVLTFYLVVEERGFKAFLQAVTPNQYHDYIGQLWGRIKDKLGLWLRGQLVLDFVVGLFSYVGLLILDVQYALLIGLLAALFETIPYAGPILTAVIAILLAFLQTGGWVKPVLVLILFLVIQRLENDLLVPKIMQKAVGLNPIISIVSLLVGFRLLGVLGAILAIPVMAVISIIWLDFIEWHQKKTDI